MIKNDKIKVNISYRNITHYIKLGYNPILNKELEIETSHLSTSSHVKIDVICKICGIENNIMYYKYIDNVERHGFYGCRKKMMVPYSTREQYTRCLSSKRLNKQS